MNKKIYPFDWSTGLEKASSRYLKIDYVEFYITNVCNLTCQGCNRFNDIKFRGWQNWNDYKDIYARWSQDLHWNHASFMGGEPLLNPTFYDWADGLYSLWRRPIGLATNGTQLHRHKKIYDYLRSRQIDMKVGIHNKKHKNDIIDQVKSIMCGPFSYEFDDTLYREKLKITDSNNVSVKIQYEWWFHQGAIIYNADGTRTLHSSDVNKAHDICHAKTCHHFDKGILYKCGPSALFPEYDSQYPLTLSDEDRNLMLDPPRLTIDQSKEEKISFLSNIKNPIPQCKFCPEVYHGEQIFSLEKKVKLNHKNE